MRAIGLQRNILFVLKAEDSYDVERFFDASLIEFNNLYGADTVVFAIIDKCDKVGMGR